MYSRNRKRVIPFFEKVVTITTLSCLLLMIGTIEIGVVMNKIPVRSTQSRLCACGCGRTPLSRGGLYLRGHNPKYEKSIKRFIPRNPPKCLCGCGKDVLWSNNQRGWALFLHGHWRRGSHQTKEARIDIGLAGKGRFQSEITRKRRSDALSGRTRPESVGRKISETLTGRPCPEYRKKRISKTLEIYFQTHPGTMQDKKHKEYSIEKMRTSHTGDKNVHWLGGVSKLPYPFGWSNGLKEQIKQRDNYQCQLPSCKGNSVILCIHHIDYDKNNLSQNNLITLCNSCNSRVNTKRMRYMKMFVKLLQLQRKT